MRTRDKIPPEHKLRGIYLIVNHANGKVYVGSTATSFYVRWKQHLGDLRKNQHYNPYLQHAWNKYGEPMFEFMIAEIIDDKTSIFAAEQFYLDIFFGNGNYNINPSVEGNQGDRKDSLVRQIFLVDPDGNTVGPILNAAEFARQHDWPSGGFATLTNGLVKSYYGWTLLKANKARKSGAGRPKNMDFENKVLQLNVEQPCTSLRGLANQLSVHFITVRNILKRHGLDYKRENCADKLTVNKLKKKQFTTVS